MGRLPALALPLRGRAGRRDPRRGPAVDRAVVIPSVSALARGWIEGQRPRDARRGRRPARGLRLRAQCAAVAADLFDVRRRVGPRRRLNAILRPDAPRLGRRCRHGGRGRGRSGSAVSRASPSTITATGGCPCWTGCAMRWRLGAGMRYRAVLTGPGALITGGGRGIGRATALRLAAEGRPWRWSTATPSRRSAVVKEIAGLGRAGVAIRPTSRRGRGAARCPEAEKRAGAARCAGQQRCPHHASRPSTPPSRRTGISSSRSRCARLS